MGQREGKGKNMIKMQGKEEKKAEERSRGDRSVMMINRILRCREKSS